MPDTDKPEPSEAEVLLGNLEHLNKILRFAQAHAEMVVKGMVSKEEETFYILAIPPDGPPTIDEYTDMDQVCQALSDIRERIIELANTLPDDDDDEEDEEDEGADQLTYWVYVFRGSRLDLTTGRVWRVRDGEEIHNVVALETEGTGDGCIVIPMSAGNDPDEVPEEESDAE